MMKRYIKYLKLLCILLLLGCEQSTPELDKLKKINQQSYISYLNRIINYHEIRIEKLTNALYECQRNQLEEVK